ncbi:hypothetical protein ACROYT_G025335 [Oculina patagonica]
MQKKDITFSFPVSESLILLERDAKRKTIRKAPVKMKFWIALLFLNLLLTTAFAASINGPFNRQKGFNEVGEVKRNEQFKRQQGLKERSVVKRSKASQANISKGVEEEPNEHLVRQEDD